MWEVVSSRVGPPAAHLAREPRIAHQLGLFMTCRRLGALPDDGGLLDQSAEYVAFADIFAQVIAEHDQQELEKAQQGGR